MPDEPSTLITRLWSRVRPYVAPDRSPEAIEKLLAEARAKRPRPTFWLFGKTQSGKSSIVKYLTGIDDATIGEGYRPCTATTKQYPFPSADTPVMTFLDTRGVGDPNYDPAEDLAVFDRDAQLMIVTVKLTDLAQGVVVEPLRTIRKANRSRPVLLVLTCLHEVDPTNPELFQSTLVQGNLTVPSVANGERSPLDRKLHDLIAHHRTTFAELADSIVAIDLTKPEEGYPDPLFGGPQIKSELMRLLPTAYRHSLQQFDAASDALKDLHLRSARPIIAGYAAAAAAVAAVPIPFVDLLVLPAIQVAMCQHLGRLSGHPSGAERFAELAASLGAGLLARQAVRELAKVIPSSVRPSPQQPRVRVRMPSVVRFVYTISVNAGHMPDADAVKSIYDRELTAAKTAWGTGP